jgi:hypothetical protein
MKFARRLLDANKDRTKFDNWLNTYKRKHRLLIIVSLLSVLGVMVLGVLLLSGALHMSRFVLTLFIILFLSGVLAGTIMLVDDERLVK